MEFGKKDITENYMTTKNWLKRRERSDTYLINLCRVLQYIESLERTLELSASIVAFTIYRSR
jgi:hypothetical protein